MTEPKTRCCYGCKQVRQVHPLATKEFATNVIRDWCSDCTQTSGRIRKTHMFTGWALFGVFVLACVMTGTRLSPWQDHKSHSEAAPHSSFVARR